MVYVNRWGLVSRATIVQCCSVSQDCCVEYFFPYLELLKVGFDSVFILESITNIYIYIFSAFIIYKIRSRKGIDSWSHGIVPHFITSNAFIGRAYAEVFRFLLLTYLCILLLHFTLNIYILKHRTPFCEPVPIERIFSNFIQTHFKGVCMGLFCAP